MSFWKTLFGIKDSSLIGSELHRAVWDGDLEKVKVLLETHPHQVVSKNSSGETPLHSAALYGYKEVAEVLLANKADVNAKADDGTTPLHRAALKGHYGITQFLLANKADVNAKSKSGSTPLSFAELSGHKEVAELLRQRL